MSEALLTLQDVHTDIEQYHILHGVTMEVPRGGVTMLLGRNGAGKTTTLRTIMGLWKARHGAIILEDQDISDFSTPDISQLGIAYVPENTGLFTDLSVEENMILAARSGKMNEDRLDWIFSLFPAMKTFWSLPAGNLSGGQKQMLAISRAIIEPRKLLIVDEPTKGLAPAIIQALTAAFEELKKSDTTILLVEQNFAMAKRLGDTVAVMDDGKIVHTGLMEDLAADNALQERLMGLSMEAHQ